MVGNYVEQVISLCPDINFEFLDGGMTSTGRAAVQWRARGSHLQRLCPNLPMQDVDTVCGLDYLVHERGRLLSSHVYFDLLPNTEQQQMRQASRQYQKSGLSSSELESYQQQLTQLMQQQQLYLNNDLTLPELAETLGLSTNHLSQVINGQFGYGFYELLNHFRAEQAKALLKGCAATAKISMLDIAFESGFGSVSAFYRAFQQHVGITPLQFRKRYC